MVPLHMKEELKCATMDSGGLFVMTAGVETMLELLVDSLDSHHGVRSQVGLQSVAYSLSSLSTTISQSKLLHALSEEHLCSWSLLRIEVQRERERNIRPS